MTPRRARRRQDEVRPLEAGYAGPGRTESGADGDWFVRPVPGAVGAKAYRCPGCDQEILPGTPHVVAWPPADPENRRHWHTPCWQARSRRGVKVHRAKNAPRHG